MNSDTFDKLLTAAGLYSAEPMVDCANTDYHRCHARCEYTTTLTISDGKDDIVKVTMHPSNLDSYDTEYALRMEAIVALLKLAKFEGVLNN